MLIDSPSMMYGTFHRCRHAQSDSGELLALLNDILGFVSQQGKLLVEVPDELIPAKWVKAIHDDTQRAIAYSRDRDQQGHDRLSSKNHSLFSLIQIGTRELQQLWAHNDQRAVQSLGYAFHVIPELLRTPEQFSSEGYMPCFRIISARWDNLSIEMREAFCRVVGLELQAAQALIANARSSRVGQDR